MQPGDNLRPDLRVRLPANEDREMLEPDTDLACMLNEVDVPFLHGIDEWPNRRGRGDLVGGIDDH